MCEGLGDGKDRVDTRDCTTMPPRQCLACACSTSAMCWLRKKTDKLLKNTIQDEADKNSWLDVSIHTSATASESPAKITCSNTEDELAVKGML